MDTTPHTAALRLRPCTDADLTAAVTWVHDPDELHRFTGPAHTWFLTSAALRQAATAPGVHAYTLVTANDGTPLGHVELAT